MNRKTIISSDTTLSIEFLGPDEPNNGRMLWKVNVFLNGSCLNDQLFNKNWNYLNFNLDQWILENENYYYFPSECESIFLNKQTQEITKLYDGESSTVSFLGNCFSPKYLIEVHQDFIKKIDLETFAIITLAYKPNKRIQTISCEDDHQLIISYYVADNSSLIYDCNEIQEYIQRKLKENPLLAEYQHFESLRRYTDCIWEYDQPQNWDLFHDSKNSLYQLLLDKPIWDLIGVEGTPALKNLLKKLENLINGEKEIVEI